MTTQLITPPENQGQIVIVSYALCEGIVVKHWHDQSDHQVIWSKSKALKDDGDYWNGAPRNKRWTRITEAEAKQLLGDDDDMI